MAFNPLRLLLFNSFDLTMRHSSTVLLESLTFFLTYASGVSSIAFLLHLFTFDSLFDLKAASPVGLR